LHDVKRRPSPAGAQAGVPLQQERHGADYDLDIVFARTRALEIVDLAADTLEEWRSLRGTPEADFFLLAMLLGRRSAGERVRAANHNLVD